MEELKRRVRDVAAFEASARAQGANVESHREALTKARRVFDGLRVHERIPEGRDEASIVATLEGAARAARMRVSSVEVEPRARETRALPAVTTTSDEFRYRPDDLREVLVVRFRLAPADVARFESFDAALRSHEPQRFIALEQARATPAGFEVTAEAYCFVPVSPPRLVVRAPTEEVLLREEPVASLLSEFGSRPGPRAELAKLRDRIARAAGASRAASAAVAPLSEANLWVARTGVLERTVARVEGRTATSLLR